MIHARFSHAMRGRVEPRRAFAQLAAPHERSADSLREKPDLEKTETVVEGYSARGFTVNGVRIHGPVILLPDLCVRFHVPVIGGLNPDSLRVIGLLESPVELLIIGHGGRAGRTALPVDAERWLLKRRISSEILPTPAACSSFNFLVQERRAVGAILFPNRGA